MVPRTTSAFSVITLALFLGAGLASCGGETDLNFVGTPGGGGDGGGPSVNCGDGTVNDDEECDDGNDDNGDGCSRSCAVEDGWTCSGEPSDCVRCGNEVIEGEEECDDGNDDDGDGCSSTCTIEGTCDMPVVIQLKQNGDGLSGSVSSAIGERDASQVGVEDCDGSDTGGGADRVFQFELPAAADLDVRVGSNFDAVVRVMTSACDIDQELACANDGAVAAEERIRIHGATPGTYYVVVDSAAARQKGTFSVDITAQCPLESLKLDRVILEPPFRTVLLNTNDSCAIDLSRVGIHSEPEAADSPATLPDIKLAPLARRVLTSESPPPAGTTYQGDIRYDVDDYAGAFYLCRGACTASGSNVIDALRWDGASGAPSSSAPSGVNFDNEKGALTDRLTQSYFRVATDGVFPDFTADDWEIAYFVETFEGEPTDWTQGAALFYDPALDSPEGTIGQRSLALTGGNPTASVWNGPKYAFKDNLGTPVDLQPTSVSLWVRSSDDTSSLGHFFFGHAGGQEDDGFGSLFRNNGTLGFGSPAVTVFLAYDAETWYFVEYKDFDYSVPGSETVTVYVDGVSRGTLNMSTGTISQLSLRNVDEGTAWIDQIIVK